MNKLFDRLMVWITVNLLKRLGYTPVQVLKIYERANNGIKGDKLFKDLGIREK